MKIVHEVDGIPIYELPSGSVGMNYVGFVIDPSDLNRLTEATAKNIHKWCSENEDAYRALDLFKFDNYHFGQYMSLEDLNLICERFKGTPEGDRAIEERELFFRSPVPTSPRGPKIRPIPKKIKGEVYILRSESGHCKIGRTSNLKRRLKALNGSSPVPHRLVCSIQSNDSYDLEKVLHEMFSHRRIRGEWFALEQCDIETIVSLKENVSSY